MMMNRCEFLGHGVVNPVGDRLLNSVHGQYYAVVAYGPAVLLCTVKLRSLDWRYQLRRGRYFTVALLEEVPKSSVFEGDVIQLKTK
jgi:hypothetical protein